jgi:RimJ/RimL family protein N-acetyltransferase
VTAPPTGPVLITARFELFRPQASDLESLYRLTEAEETRRFLGNIEPSRMDSFQRLLRNAGSWALYGYGVFMVRSPGRHEIVGSCGVFRSFRGFGKGLDDVPEAGWIVRRDLWSQGVASEVMTATLAWFDAEHGRQRVACMIEDGHCASAAIAAKLGFTEYERHAPEGGRELVLYERW